ncbi:sugar MFS transporter [Emticicia sp. BO119]|uniref:MFS transporter n=1 Tax=Emticicia sp. BO119 TaxID=2757768 RepID=UPI0015F01F43|nr:MFS transporter [Emticicia sp. BO119]MBA4851252.1 MFS transporter [Emticicia sp. BO119]
MVNDSRLFNASCFALITTAFSFSIRAGILPQLQTELNLTGEEVGIINSMWFYGFPLSMIIGGLVYHSVGPKAIMQFAFLAHFVGIILTIYGGSYIGLLISTFLIGLGNGCTEAACNPLIADTYSGNKMNTMLNRFHMWFPGGIVIGSLLSEFMTTQGFAWQTQIWIILIPTIIYAFLFYGQAFPKPKVEGVTSVGNNLKAMATPLFIFIFICMILTATTEFGPQQWVGLILKSSGAKPMLILALVTGLMAVARFFGGAIIHRFDQTGVLLGSAVLATIGVYLFSTQTGTMAYVAAIFFAMGVAYFWPTMIGFTAERVPLSGALGMSVIGGIGMLSQAFMNPQIGKWLDTAKENQASKGLVGEALELAAGQEVLGILTLFPLALIVLFTVLYFWQRGKRPVHA